MLQVLFKDRNFRGLGENFELLLLSKEGVEVHSNSAPLVVKLRWQDCTIGKLSRFSIGYDSEPFYDFMRNLLSTSMLRRTSMPTTGRNTRIRMPIQKKTAYIQYGL